MKNLFQIILIFIIAFIVSCSNTATNNENTTVEATTEIANEEEIEALEVIEREEDIIEDANEELSEETETNEEKEKKPLAEVKPLPVSKETEKAEVEKEKSNTVIPDETPIVQEQKKENIQEKEEEVIPAKPQKQIPNHENFDKLLRKYVSNTGQVNYSGFKADKTSFENYLNNLAENSPKNDWSRNEKMAYWINAYNAYTIKLIVDNYPVKSITDLHGGKPWDVKWIKFGDKTYSLNNIENDILRPKYKDARIHFAVNCAAKSCPTLLNRAWTASNLNSYFNKQAKAFINNSVFNQISEKEVKISKIFEWYAVDFDNLIDYLNKYSNVKIADNATVSYQEYDWALNN